MKHEMILTRWLEAEESQPPLLLAVSDGADWEAVKERLKGLPVCEQLIEVATGERSISIDAVRAVMPQINRTVLKGKRLVAIDQVHKLSMPAANALLKVLEEPPASARFLLATQWPQRLPATLRSRCQRINIASRTVQESAAARRFDAWRYLCDAKKEELPEEALRQIASRLEEKLRAGGPSAEVRRGYMRLRDYYRITGSGGNERAARDVLLGAML
jgi:DNA polymerase III delta prime subunit